MAGLATAVDRSLIEIDRALEDVAAGLGRVIVVRGRAGLGKSALLTDTARAAGSREFIVAAARGRRDRRDQPGSTLTAALAAAFRHTSSTSAPERLIDTLGTGDPVALLIDDGHLADDASLQQIVAIAEDIESRRILLVLAMRPHVLDDAGRQCLETLIRLAHPLEITLLPLGRERAHELVRGVLPNASADFCSACLELTGGNPFLLNELVTWISAHRLELDADTALRALEPVPPRAMRRFVRMQVEELGPQAGALASALAFADRPITLEEASQLSGLDRANLLSAVDALLESGLVTPGEPMWFAAPLAAHCLRASATPELAARMRRKVAELAGEHDRDPATTAQHLLLAPPSGDPRVVEHLIELADEEEARGNPGEAGALIRRALDERADESQETSRLLVRLGHLDLVQGRSDSTASLATGVAGLEHVRDRAEGLLKLAIAQLDAGSPRDAATAFERAAALAPADDPMHMHAEANAALADLLVPERRAAAIARLEAMRGALKRNAEPIGAELLLAAAWVDVCRGAPVEEVEASVRLALAEREGVPIAPGGYFHTAAATLLALSDDLAEADRVCEKALSEVRAAGSALAERNVQLAQALAHLHGGRLERAAELAGQLLATGSNRTLLTRAGAAAILAEIMQERDEFDAAESLIRHSLESAPSELPQLLLLHAKARLCLRRDALADALAASNEAEHLALSLEILNPAIVPWQPVAALCYARSGDRRRADQLLDEAGTVAETFGAARGRSLVLRTKARVLGHPSDLPLLELAHSLTASSPAIVERTKVLVDYGVALHRAGRNEAARSLLRQGIDLADKIGAIWISRRGLAALLAAGGRPRRVRMTGPEALTPAERRIAEMAARGASNREIAEALVVVVKTVEWHLRKAYVKLGVSSREELADALDL